MNNNVRNHDRLLAEAMQEGIIILNPECTINWWNHVASNLLLLEHSKDEGKLITDVVKDEKFRELFSPDASTNVIDMCMPKYPEYTLSVCRRPYWQGQELLIVTDVTHTRHLEAMRQNFIADVSHELRTPLTVLRGYLELLQDRAELNSGSEFNEWKVNEILNQMAKQSQRMEQLVQDLLLLSRLESYEPDLAQHKPIFVAEILKSICVVAKSLSGDKQHNFHLELDEDLQLNGKAEELHSAFSNIIYNAVNYTPAQGQIEIYWSQDERGKHVKIKDTGIGIEAKYIPYITRRFYRVDKARSSQVGGTGLGLAIVKHVLIRHRGELHIESEVGKGSTFICTFPEGVKSDS